MERRTFHARVGGQHVHVPLSPGDRTDSLVCGNLQVRSVLETGHAVQSGLSRRFASWDTVDTDDFLAFDPVSDYAPLIRTAASSRRTSSPTERSTSLEPTTPTAPSSTISRHTTPICRTRCGRTATPRTTSTGRSPICGTAVIATACGSGTSTNSDGCSSTSASS